jgi:hypothetical protein
MNKELENLFDVRRIYLVLYLNLFFISVKFMWLGDILSRKMLNGASGALVKETIDRKNTLEFV